MGIPFGPLLGGLVEAARLSATLMVAAAIFLVAALAPFVLPGFAEMNRRTAAAPSQLY